MKAIDFYKFITDNGIEFHWFTNKYNERDVCFFVDFWLIEKFYEILSKFDFDEEGIECAMKDGYFAFVADEIINSHGIELTEIFGKDE